METPAFALPTVNVGIRQQGREKARNVLDAEATPDSILQAIHFAGSSAFRDSLRGLINPYGDGHASERIAKVLTSVPISEDLLIKRACKAKPARSSE